MSLREKIVCDEIVNEIWGGGDGTAFGGVCEAQLTRKGLMRKLQLTRTVTLAR